ncbi:hypothetical protein MNBD_GAMMA06-1131 [hydrothermal vent metagenome]|uniref:Beta-lactamase-related domain-containing protein n=1 Tax=hydrothermal vent metagenome TaxID=652676 RepID=A0A3B0WNW0_9ZZZZ
MKYNKVAVVAILITLTVTGCTSAPQRPATINKGDYGYLKEYLSWSISKKMDQYNIKGLSIAIIDGQKIVWQKGFGLADEEKNIPASSKTVYRIGSISKVITAAQIMRLQQSGKINIDDPVTKYITDFSIANRFENTKPITLRALLSHHSGLPSDILAGMWVHDPVSLSKLTDEIKSESLTSPPQSMYKYSNIGYSVLGKIIEVVENKPFPQVMSESFLQPLGMKHSSFNLTPKIKKFYAEGYRDGEIVDKTPLRDIPAGAMLSNVEDMGNFLRYLFSGKSISDNTHIQPKSNEIFTPQYAGLPLDFNHKIGLDWIIGGLTSSIEGDIFWHNGAAVPHQAHISLLPNKKLGIVILANTDEASQFITELGVKSLELAVEAKFARKLPELVEPKNIVEVNVADNILDEYVGNYVVFGNMTAISRKENHLEIELWGNKLNLIPISNDTFIPQANALGFISIPLLKYSLQFKTVQGKSLALLRGLPAPFAFQKIPKYIISETWKKRLGAYQTNTHDELFKLNNLQLEINNGVLLFNTTIQGKSSDSGTKLKIALTPISDTEAIVTGLENGEGNTVKIIKTGASENIYYSGFIFSPIDKKKLNVIE